MLVLLFSALLLLPNFLVAKVKKTVPSHIVNEILRKVDLPFDVQNTDGFKATLTLSSKNSGSTLLKGELKGGTSEPELILSEYDSKAIYHVLFNPVYGTTNTVPLSHNSHQYCKDTVCTTYASTETEETKFGAIFDEVTVKTQLKVTREPVPENTPPTSSHTFYERAKLFLFGNSNGKATDVKKHTAPTTKTYETKVVKNQLNPAIQNALIRKSTAAIAAVVKCGASNITTIAAQFGVDSVMLISVEGCNRLLPICGTLYAAANTVLFYDGNFTNLVWRLSVVASAQLIKDGLKYFFGGPQMIYEIGMGIVDATTYTCPADVVSGKYEYDIDWDAILSNLQDNFIIIITTDSFTWRSA